MRQVVKYIIGAITFLVICYFGYQGYSLYIYNAARITSDYKEVKDHFKIGDTIVAKHVALTQNEYKNIQGIKIKNIVKKFDIYKQNATAETYVLYNDRKEIEKSFSISVGDSYIKKIKSNQFGKDKSFQTLKKKEILKKYNIRNDIELWEKIQEKKEEKSNIFTDVKTMKEQYFFQYTMLELPVIENITLINGDLTGYIFNISADMKEVHILDNDKQYTFLFNGAYQSQEIEEFLNTIII